MKLQVTSRLFLLVILLFPDPLLKAQHVAIHLDTTVTTQHTVTIKGVKIQYSATVGTQPLWDEDGTPVASLHYTYYQRSGIDDISQRPLLISFNGGPGSGSVWMHIAYTGPRILNIDDEGFPVQPYGIRENGYSVLDVADIVYVNPVNTGYSRAVPVEGETVDRDRFFGVEADIKYLGDWLTTFVSRNGRWTSPKFLIGESYGGERVSGLALELEENHWMYLNGVILVSPADYNIYFSDTPIPYSLNLPYFTAAAWYHKQLPAELQEKDLLEILPEVEEYTITTLLPALAKGSSLAKTEREEIAAKMAWYTGLSAEDIMQFNLSVPDQFFWKDLLREESGKTIGRLDSRYLGMDRVVGGSGPESNPEMSAWLHAFTPAINYYFREYLGFETDLTYNMFGDVHPWDNETFNTREMLGRAMVVNPYLKVMYQVGYYDGGTPYFNTKYSMWQLDPGGVLQDRIQFIGYRSGHMMYLRTEDLKKASEDLRSFLLSSLPGELPAKY